MKHLAIGLLAGCVGYYSACAQGAVPMPLAEGAKSAVEPPQAREAACAVRAPAGTGIGKAVADDDESTVADRNRAARGALDARGNDEQDRRPRGGGHPAGWRALVPGALR
jgi:hypothetical protein